MSEQSIVNATILALAKQYPEMRLWRQNTGVAVGWGIVQRALQTEDWSVLRRARPIKFSVPGAADVTGITPDGRRLEIELKTESGKQREEQKNFEQMIRAAGGIYILARSPEEAMSKFREDYEREREIINKETDRLLDMIEWFTHRSGRGDVGLCEEMYDLDIEEGRWDGPEAG